VVYREEDVEAFEVARTRGGNSPAAEMTQ